MKGAVTDPVIIKATQENWKKQAPKYYGKDWAGTLMKATQDVAKNQKQEDISVLQSDPKVMKEFNKINKLNPNISFEAWATSQGYLK
jgi:hypothetical protein